ncbi:MAG: hypothetical protein GY794_08935 [bacterium]|nr:hypothetical protein [bacterium]
MAIPIGTTSRQLGALVRWMYLTVVLLGMLTWWWPEYSTWGALIGGLIITLLLWLCWQTVSINRTIPGHPIYLVLLIPAAILIYHLARTGLGVRTDNLRVVSGALNASLLFHMAMLALCVMLSQSLLPGAMRYGSVPRICGAVMIAGGILVGFRDDATPVRTAMSLVGYAGIPIWLAPLWRPGISIAQQGFDPPAHQHMMRICSLAAAVLAGGLLGWNCPVAMILASGFAGITLVAASVIFSRRSRWLLIVGAILMVGGTLGGAIHGGVLPGALNTSGPLLGSGEEAFGQVIAQDRQVVQAISARDSGLQILLGTIGLPGTILTVMGLVGILVMFLVCARRDHTGDKAQCVAWATASLLCMVAMLSSGGMFIPAVVLGFGLTWGLLSDAAGRAPRPRPGIALLVVLMAVTVLLGVTQSSGLINWVAHAFWSDKGGDKLLHAIFGMMLSMTLAWLLGSRNLRWGLLAIALAALSGGIGEIIQLITSTGRLAEWSDWGAHATGSILAVIPYVLCVGARQCESSDATGQRHPKVDPYNF